MKVYIIKKNRDNNVYFEHEKFLGKQSISSGKMVIKIKLKMQFRSDEK